MPDTPAVETPAATNGADLRQIARRHIVIRGARQHNLKNIDLDLPKGKLIVFTGPSGSGKSSLAFDTIYAEGQRRYVESLSAYARQFLERMDKPDADLITGLAPAIAIEQKTTSKNPRSTVATQTEIYDHLRLLFARIGTTYSPVSGEPVTKDSPRSVAETLTDRLDDRTRFYLCFPLPAHGKSPVRQELEVLRQRGFFRLVVLPTEKQAEKGETESVLDLNETPPEKVRVARERLLVLVDRLAVRKGDEATRSRIADSVEQAFREGGGRCVALVARGGPRFDFSTFFERDGMRFEEPTPHLFSFNSPLGACPTCQGFGRVPGLDEDLIIPNPDLSIRQGAIAPFRTEQWNAYFRDLIRIAARERIDIDAPYHRLSEREKEIVWHGKDDYAGILGFFRFLEKHSYKMHYRIYHARFRGYSRCPDCEGFRLRKEALYVKVGGLHIGEVCELTTKDAWDFFEHLTLTPHQEAVAGRVLEEIRKRLRYLVEVGLDYLTLDRLSQTLSGGESQRINLATSLGSSLVGSLYVLDEPSIGLHPRDTDRLIRILEHLRDIGNTVLVVEHEAAMMRRADQIVDLGPGAGRLGGEVVFQGTYDELLRDARSLTGAYLSGRKSIPVPERRRPVDPDYALVLEGARQHNLKRLDVRFPLGVLCCVTGVSGSGKSTLVHDTLYQALRRLKGQHDGQSKVGAHDALRGHQYVDQVEMVDQSPIGQTPRSNPVTYIKAFDAIRNLMADTHLARIRGYKPGYFSFNVPGGRCEVCQGEGFVRVEMQFLADLYLECEACKGKRYKQDVLEVRYRGKNIDDILNMTVDEAVAFFEDVGPVVNKLQVLQDIGLGYLTLGQPSNTLSGGEAQRIKLAAHLGKTAKDRTLFLFDEPTTGLHFDDIRKLLAVFHRLVDAGHSVLIVEHNLDVIKCADWVIDLGPEGGRRGGFVVAEGTPEDLAAHPESHTGRFLREVL
ncbi:excinuclease ABC subunit UvrA [Rhodocaloribacter litoris]|uniref:excinuclease ABC subunit UvrA n=1 Tax=Rhodocaloribacter litoris TaxID=2558931 RepID=UPI001423CCD5|nr:excinuclease ABC subunit UvrA [Rhodocaloribacter litoris]QXD17107.1 excinuclease ABC subunit UvrA [Rhodocaloribacter litoris]